MQPDPDPDDDRADALAEAIRSACAGYPDLIVAQELLVALGELIGRKHTGIRKLMVEAVADDLRQYVSEIPPHPDDPAA